MIFMREEGMSKGGILFVVAIILVVIAVISYTLAGSNEPTEQIDAEFNPPAIGS